MSLENYGTKFQLFRRIELWLYLLKYSDDENIKNSMMRFKNDDPEDFFRKQT